MTDGPGMPHREALDDVRTMAELEQAEHEDRLRAQLSAATPVPPPPDDPDGSANVVDGVAHFCAIRPGRDDVCGGCGAPWPCPHRVPVHVDQQAPTVDQDAYLRALVDQAVSERLSREGEAP